MTETQPLAEDGDGAASSRRPPPEDVFRSFAGTIRKGMEIVDGDDRHVGHVEAVEGELIKLRRTDPTQSRFEFLPLSLVDGITDTRILLSTRGDASFGLGAAEP